jgi:hypothetical protein
MPAFVASLLPLAGCAAMMVVCSRMMRGGDCASSSPAEPTEIAQLRAEIAELRTRLDQPPQWGPGPLRVR